MISGTCKEGNKKYYLLVLPDVLMALCLKSFRAKVVSYVVHTLSLTFPTNDCTQLAYRWFFASDSNIFGGPSASFCFAVPKKIEAFLRIFAAICACLGASFYCSFEELAPPRCGSPFHPFTVFHFSPTGIRFDDLEFSSAVTAGTAI